MGHSLLVRRMQTVLSFFSILTWKLSTGQFSGTLFGLKVYVTKCWSLLKILVQQRILLPRFYNLTNMIWSLFSNRIRVSERKRAQALNQNFKLCTSATTGPTPGKLSRVRLIPFMYRLLYVRRETSYGQYVESTFWSKATLLPHQNIYLWDNEFLIYTIITIKSTVLTCITLTSLDQGVSSVRRGNV